MFVIILFTLLPPQVRRSQDGLEYHHHLASVHKYKSSAHAQQRSGVVKSRVSADIHGFRGGELDKSSTGLLSERSGCSGSQNLHYSQSNGLTANEADAD